MNVITIEVSGPTQSGKTAVFESIRRLLDEHGYCVAVPSREQRLNPGCDLNSAPWYEKPHRDKTVVIMSEVNTTIAAKGADLGVSLDLAKCKVWGPAHQPSDCSSAEQQLLAQVPRVPWGSDEGLKVLGLPVEFPTSSSFR